METDSVELDNLQFAAERMYGAVRKQHITENLKFAGVPLPDGSVPTAGNGVTLLPSHTEMQDLAGLISLVLSSWTQSGKMPAVAQLHSSAESSEVDPVVYIITLYSTAMLGAFLPCVCSGDLGTAMSILELMTSVEVQPATSPSTSSKRTLRPLSGRSSTDSQETTSPSSPSTSAAPDTKSTSKDSRKKKKRSPKPRPRQKKGRTKR